MYCVAVNADGESALVARIAQALNQDEHGWGLGIVQACIVAHHDIVVLDVDVGHFVRVKGRDERFICACQAAAQGLIAVKAALRSLQSLKLIALRRQVLQDATNLHDFGVAKCLQLGQVVLRRAMSRVLDRLLDESRLLILRLIGGKLLSLNHLFARLLVMSDVFDILILGMLIIVDPNGTLI